MWVVSNQQQRATQAFRHVGRIIQSQNEMEVSKMGGGGIHKEMMQVSQVVSSVRPELGTCGENKRRESETGRRWNLIWPPDLGPEEEQV